MLSVPTNPPVSSLSICPSGDSFSSRPRSQVNGGLVMVTFIFTQQNKGNTVAVQKMLNSHGKGESIWIDLILLLSPVPPLWTIVLTGCGINWLCSVVVEAHCTFGRPFYWIARESKEARPCIPESFFIVLHRSVSPPFRVRCNKIATQALLMN